MADTVGSHFSTVPREGNSEKIFTFISIFLGKVFVGEEVEINWLETRKVSAPIGFLNRPPSPGPVP